MLLQFSFGNFRSFRDKTTLDMTAATRLHSDPALDTGNVVNVPRTGGVLRVAAIYGANASGKSNIANALTNFKITLTRSANTDFSIQSHPFLLNRTAIHEPMFYEIIFLLDEKQFRYGFEICQKDTGSNIRYEWLYEASSSREKMLFERDNNKIKRGRGFNEGSHLLYKGLLRREDSLYMSLLAQNASPLPAKLVAHLWKGVNVLNGIGDEKLRPYTVNCIKEGRFVNELDTLLKEADTGISSIILEDDFPFTIETPVETPDNVKDFLANQLKQQFEITAIHNQFDEKGEAIGEVHWAFSVEESQGTQKLFALAGTVFDTLENGNVLFVDEMDARFHPNLTRALVQLFQSAEANPKNAQLIFVTHDTNLLDKRFNRFRRDQIWFVEKDRFGASHLYSLAEIKGVREPSEVDYIQGVYGAIPFLGGMDKLIREGFDTDGA